MTSIFLPFHHV